MHFSSLEVCLYRHHGSIHLRRKLKSLKLRLYKRLHILCNTRHFCDFCTFSIRITFIPCILKDLYWTACYYLHVYSLVQRLQVKQKDNGTRRILAVEKTNFLTSLSYLKNGSDLNNYHAKLNSNHQLHR